MSGISSNAGLLPGNTRDLHVAVLSLYLKVTICTPHSSILDWVNAFNTTELFLVAHNAFCVDFGIRFLKILNGIKLPSLPESILYVKGILFDWYLTLICWIFQIYIVKGKVFDLYWVKHQLCLSCSTSWGLSFCLTSWNDLLPLGGLWSCSCLCTDLHIVLKWLVFLHPLHILP